MTLFVSSCTCNAYQHQCFCFATQGKGIDCFATHPGIADTRLYPKLDTGKPEGKGIELFEKVPWAFKG